MQQPKNTRRKRRDDPAQLVFRFADSLVLENEALRTKVDQLNEELAKEREKLEEVAGIMELYAMQIRRRRPGRMNLAGGNPS